MYTDGTLGFMLQGVSQQPERVQPDGHVREQINMMSDPNTGLSSRAGSELVAIIDDIPATARHRTTNVGSLLVRLSADDDYIAAVDYEGTEYTIADPNNYSGYFGKNMAYYAQDNLIYCVNRDKTVTASDPNPNVLLDWGFMQALGGEYSRTYKIKLRFDDATVIEAEYTTPDADATDAADAIAASAIIASLDSALATALTDASYTTLVRARREEVLFMRDTTQGFTVTVDDQANNTIIRAGDGKQGVKSFADLPKYSDANTAIKVRGQQGTISDDVWLIYTIPNITGGGFGNLGTWIETVDPDAAEVLDLATMPHALEIDGSTMTIIRPEWRGRRVGNEDISPTPSFVGRQIRDIVSFQNRIAVIAGPYAVMTRTDDNLDFYRRTATTQLATDPIDIRTAGADDSFMEWMIPYDNNLIITAQDGQFFISGINSLTSSNAAMPRSSNFEMSITATPVVAGQTVMLPFNLRAFSGINEMLPTEEGTANTLESINNVTPRYIRGEIIGMTASANAKFLGVHTNDPAVSNTIFVYNFLWENNQKVQAAWHRWTFPDPIEHVHTRNNIVYVWTRYDGSTWLTALKLDKPIDDAIGYHITADYLLNVDTTETIVMPRPDYEFIASADGTVYAKGSRITPLSVTASGDNWVYVLPSGIPDDVVGGVPIPLELRPNRPFPVDWRGNKKFSDKLVIQKFVIDYEQSGSLTAFMDSVWRNDGVLTEIVGNRTIPAANDPEDSFQTAVKDGSLEVPWGEESKLANLVIKAETMKPINIVEIRWFGQAYKGKG